MDDAETSLWALIKEAFASFSRHGGRLLAGAIAFFTLLSLAPILVIAMYITGLVTSEAHARAELTHGLSRFIGPHGSQTVTDVVGRLSESDSGALLGIAHGLVLLYAATRLFSQLKRSLNFMWDVEEVRQSGLKVAIVRQVEKRLAAIGLVLLISVVILASVVSKALFSAATHFVDATGGAPGLWQAVDLALSYLIMAVLFAAIYRLLPDVRIAWRDIWVGSLLTAALFTLGTYLIGIYLGWSSTASTFGTAGSVVVLLVWVNYSAQVFFVGAAFTGTWARRRGGGLSPTRFGRARPDSATFGPYSTETHLADVPHSAPGSRRNLARDEASAQNERADDGG